MPLALCTIDLMAYAANIRRVSILSIACSSCELARRLKAPAAMDVGLCLKGAETYLPYSEAEAAVTEFHRLASQIVDNGLAADGAITLRVVHADGSYLERNFSRGRFGFGEGGPGSFPRALYPVVTA